MTARTKTRLEAGKILVEMGGNAYTLDRLCDLETLWNSLGDAVDENHIPYWTELWPASLALAEWLTGNAGALANRPLLDLGCGLGFLSLLAASLGASVLGMDYEADALSYARRNAAQNGAVPLFACMDWSRPAVAAGAFGCIIGADIVYEARFIEPLAAFLAHALARDGTAWIADPCRSFFGIFVDELAKKGLEARVACEKIVAAANTGSIPIKVKIWQIGFTG